MTPIKKNVGMTPVEELMKLDKKDLIERIVQLQAHNIQLKNIISKNSSLSSIGSEIKDVNKKKKQLDFSKCHFRRVLLRISYFGWDYNGFVVQEDTNQTIENHLFHALNKSCLIESRELSNYHRCGRTDKGVSALGQVISISLRSKFPLGQQNSQEAIDNEMPYCKILNGLLPKDIKVVAWYPIPEDKPDYSARFDCKKRTYKYYFPRSSLDIEAMRLGCARLIGSHDYRNLCKMDVGNGVVQFRREIFTADIFPVNNMDCELPTSMHYLLIEGNAFLWHQIRCIMGILLLIGGRKESPEVISELLDVENHPRKPQYNMALDVPLNLSDCSYDLPSSGWKYEKHQHAALLAHMQREWTCQSIKATVIKEAINQLESQYLQVCGGQVADCDRVVAYTTGLLQGDKAKVYTPLLKRVKCPSLEEKLEANNRKKRKIEDLDETA